MIDATYNYIGTVSVKTAREIIGAFPEVEISGITDENEIEIVVPDTIDEEVVARLQRIVAVWDTPSDAVIDALFGDTEKKSSEIVYIVRVYDGGIRPYVHSVYHTRASAEARCMIINQNEDQHADIRCEIVWQ